MTATLITMDCRAGMGTLPANSVDSIVTDPPYGLSKKPDMREVLKHWLNGDDYEHKGGGFMGKSWDSFVPGPLTWEQAYRILKPGGYCAVFAGSRTVDLMATSLRLAGFEIVDQLQWLYGTGFPKSMNIEKALEMYEVHAGSYEWVGFGTALKPCHEPIILCRKPLDGTYAHNIMTHNVGALNIDGCRVEAKDSQLAKKYASVPADSVRENAIYGKDLSPRRTEPHPAGRWPGNVLHDGCLPEPMDRYFYCAKASKTDREDGLEDFEMHSAGEVTGGRKEGSAGLDSPRTGAGRTSGAKNVHPTVKPTELMRWLCRLVTPPGGLVLDPFTGSGSTGRGAVLEGFEFLGFEMSAKYSATAEARIKAAQVLT